MKHFLALSVGLLLMSGTTSAADQTWVGSIGDSHCGAAAHATEFKGDPIAARDCIVGRESGPAMPGCLKAFGAKFIFVKDGKVYNISNQEFPALRQYAAQTVQLTGELKGDTLTVKGIAPVR